MDQLVQARAHGCRDMAWEQRVLIRDEVVIRVNTLLAQRAEELLQYDSQEGPQITFPGSDAKESQKPLKKAKKGPKQTKIVKFKSSARPKNQAAVPGENKPNKRRQMESMLAGTSPDLRPLKNAARVYGLAY